MKNYFQIYTDIFGLTLKSFDMGKNGKGLKSLPIVLAVDPIL
jgi:hypothetical protein